MQFSLEMNGFDQRKDSPFKNTGSQRVRESRKNCVATSLDRLHDLNLYVFCNTADIANKKRIKIINV